jgi:peptidyl-prolyl cis-trans isomerase C
MKRPLLLLLALWLSSACGQPETPAGDAAQPAAAGDEAATLAPGSLPGELPAVVARVNGEAIERWELENAARAAEADAGAPIPAEQRDEVMRTLLQQLVELHALAQEARVRNLSPSAEDVEAQLNDIRQGFTTEEELLESMAQDGTSLEQVRQDIARRLGVDMLLNLEIMPTISVADAEVRAFYDDNIEQFQETESVRTSHILIAVAPTATDEERQRALVKTEEILNRLRTGADFAAVARAESEDPGSAPQGGELGFVARGQMMPEFEAAAFGLEPGAISVPVGTQYGFHIIKAHERRGPRTAPFEEVAGQIEQFLRSQQGQARTGEFVQRLIATAMVEIYL